MIKQQRIWLPLLLLLICMTFFFANRNPTHTYDRIINADMKSYYAFLPAIVIHQDLEFGFVDDYETKYYPADKSQKKDFVLETKDGKVNKTYPGVAILLAPFFLLAHFLTLITGGAADGYSIIYQFALVAAVWAYFLMGCYFAHKILERFKFKPTVIAIALSAVVLGSNMMYYVSFDFTVSHIFNFFLVTYFLWQVGRFLDNGETKHFLIICFLLALMVVVRPTNLLTIGLITIMFDQSNGFIQHLRSRLNLKKMLIGIGVGLVVMLVPITIFLIQIGKPFAYGYGNEGFDFLHPHLKDFLISYKKGWLLYSPLLIICLGSIYFWFRQNKLQASTGLIFVGVMVYVYSSWWAWNFGAGFGERVMIDYSIIYMIPLAYLIQRIWQLKLRSVVVSILALFSFLSVFQSWQTFAGILPGARVTEDIYWDNFLSMRKKARYYFEAEKLISMDTYVVDFESPDGLTNEWQITDYDAYEGRFSAALGNGSAFGVTKKITVPVEHLKESSHFRIGAYVKALKPLDKSVLVAAFEQDSELLQYNAFEIKRYVVIGEWIYVEFGGYIQIKSDAPASLTIYPWDPGESDKFLMDNLRIDLMHVSED